MANEKDAKKEKDRAVALKNIESALWNYALPKLVTFENFGRLSEGAKEKYTALIQKTPSQEMYEQLFAPQLVNEGGAVTSSYVQNASAAIIQQSFAMLKVDDLTKYVGVKGSIKESYKGKYVADLDKKEIETLISYAMQFGINKKIVELVGDESKGIASGLEKIICEEPKEEKK
jgi:hypothetical protein